MAHRIGVLGYGSIGKRHAENLVKLGATPVLYDPALPHSIRDMAVDDTDGIVIATPIAQHYQDLMDALQTKKPIFCEKPIAHIGHERFKQVPLVGYNLRFHPCVQAAKEWVPQLGALFSADFICAQYNEKYSDNVVLNWSHEIDLARYLIGPANLGSIMSLGIYDRKVGTHVSAKSMWSKLGAPTIVSVHLDYFADPQIRQFIIIGEKGQIIVDLAGRHGWLRAPGGELLDAIDGTHVGFDGDYMDEMKEFIGIIEGDRPYNLGCTGEEALEALEICHKIMEQLK